MENVEYLVFLYEFKKCDNFKHPEIKIHRDGDPYIECFED